ncbi:hypothetical protein CM19_09370 [Candidatus Acidianus copahuensis]|uniref:Ubiquitin n=1 Tax=Candidatus Acidianus copahuensis TaxID=1160895 RepID=A0A031LJT9_9CREN|nr:hypothetical protein [Candidatus Acidianus copahuensis]EZQ03043.1 hypothetical protein CM19_09370 [Candidatus Acidianus copahuensis]
MKKIILLGPLSNQLGFKEKDVDGSDIIDIISKVDRKGIILQNGKIKPGYIILINGVDLRIKSKVSDGDVIYVVPINHGG